MTSEPTSTRLSPTTPSNGATMLVYPRSIFALFKFAFALTKFAFAIS